MVKKQIAIVDDETEFHKSQIDDLSSQYEISVFSSPQSFLEHINYFIDFPFDTIICNYKINGKSSLDMITEAHNQGYHFPFVMYSNDLNKESVIAAINVGAYRFVDKKSSSNQIMDVIEAVIVENGYRKIRKDIRNVTNQLNELFSNVIMILEKYAPLNELEKLVVEVSPDGKIRKKNDAKSFLRLLETKLERLTTEEEFLEIVKDNLYKKSS